jgi:nicotinamidase-related amidase
MNRALIVIDVQESFRQQPMWAAISQPDIAGQVDRLVRAARARGDLVVWVLHSEPGTGTVFDPADGHVRLMDGLAPSEGEPGTHRGPFSPGYPRSGWRKDSAAQASSVHARHLPGARRSGTPWAGDQFGWP